jgi:hypothetical protein
MTLFSDRNFLFFKLYSVHFCTTIVQNTQHRCVSYPPSMTQAGSLLLAIGLVFPPLLHPFLTFDADSTFFV